MASSVGFESGLATVAVTLYILFGIIFPLASTSTGKYTAIMAESRIRWVYRSLCIWIKEQFKSLYQSSMKQALLIAATFYCGVIAALAYRDRLRDFARLCHWLGTTYALVWLTPGEFLPWSQRFFWTFFRLRWESLRFAALVFAASRLSHQSSGEKSRKTSGTRVANFALLGCTLLWQ